MHNKKKSFIIFAIVFTITQLLIACGTNQTFEPEQTTTSQKQVVQNNSKNITALITVTETSYNIVNQSGQSLNLVKLYNLEQATKLGVKTSDVVRGVANWKDVIGTLNSNVTIVTNSLLPSSNVEVLVFLYPDNSELDLYFDQYRGLLQAKLPDKDQYITVTAPNNLAGSIHFY